MAGTVEPELRGPRRRLVEQLQEQGIRDLAVLKAIDETPLPSDPKEALASITPERFAIGVNGEHPRIIAVADAVEAMP